MPMYDGDEKATADWRIELHGKPAERVGKGKQAFTGR